MLANFDDCSLASSIFACWKEGGISSDFAQGCLIEKQHELLSSLLGFDLQFSTKAWVFKPRILDNCSFPYNAKIKTAVI